MSDIVKLYLIAGQSNANRDAMAAAVVAACGSSNFEIVRTAKSSTSLAAVPDAQDWAPTSNELFAKLTEAAADRIAYIEAQGFTAEVHVLWVQGERDAADAAHASDYGSNEVAFFAALNEAIGRPINPVIVGLAAPVPAYAGLVHAGQADAAHHIGAGFIETAGSHYVDGLHYALDAQAAIASAFIAQAGLSFVPGYVSASHGENWMGSAAADAFVGGFFGDTLAAGAGNDSVAGGYGANLIVGGLGDDTLSAAFGNDTIVGGAGHDVLLGGVAITHQPALKNAAPEFLAGIDRDRLSGNGGNDVIDGGIGNDVIRGGLGNDTMTGGAGCDQFIFAAEDAAAGQIDVITDFAKGDHIVARGLAVWLTDDGFDIDVNADGIADLSVLTPGATSLDFIL